MKSIVYKAYRSIIPCLLLTLSIGFCYAFSLFTPHIAEAIGVSRSAAQFTFCLNIGFLGLGAATFGPLVEKRVKAATFISAILLSVGLLLGGIACKIGSLSLMYLGCGVFCGLAEGGGYIAPNKNMLLWFPASHAKGLLSAISIFTFGLGSALCSWLFGFLFPRLGISGTFFALAAIYAVPTLIAAFLIQKPTYALIRLRNETKSTFSYLSRLKDRFFQLSWLYMFLNISMGLVLIGSCASILKAMGLESGFIITTMMMCGIANGAGRLICPAISDRYFSKNRSNAFILIVILEVVFMIPIIMYYFSVVHALVAAFSIVLIHGMYGGAFSCLPSILASHYGKDTLSQTHGFCLTSWGMASFMAYFCISSLVATFSEFLPVMIIVLVGYVANIFVAMEISKCK